ncbi:MAG: hypothetical protein ACYDD9_07755 [Acidithiobacillus sp.]
MKERILDVLAFSIAVSVIVIANCMPLYSSTAVKNKDCLQVKSGLPAVLQKGFCYDSNKS